MVFTIADLNGLQVKASGIMNAYGPAPITANILTVLGPDFGADVRKKTMIFCVLYALKSSRVTFRNYLADCMHHMGYKYYMADQYLWLKHEVRPSNGFEYYSYILCYVEDIFCIHHDSMAVLNKLDK